jgi:four helix bundle protein
MNIETKRPGAHAFVALEVAIQIVAGLREVVAIVRRHDADLARQIVRAGSSIAANVAEGSRRQGKDRLHCFRIAAGSAAETQAHLRIALAWGWVQRTQIESLLGQLDRELGLLWGLTH